MIWLDGLPRNAVNLQVMALGTIDAAARMHDGV